MATESIELTTLIPASPEAVFEAWLDSALHTAMTGGSATIEPRVGGAHSAWNGYVEGHTLELEPGRRIVQSWRSTQFPSDSPHSQVEITLEGVAGGTRLLLVHTEIPAGQGESYRSGWVEHYFTPMTAFFGGGGKAAPARAAAKKARAPSAKKTASKPAAKKPAARKPAAKKPAAKKPAAKKKGARKPAAKKGAARRAAKKSARKPATRKAASKPAAKKGARKAAARPAARKGAARSAAGKAPKRGAKKA